MIPYSKAQFGTRVADNYASRRRQDYLLASADPRLSGGLETRPLGHPAFADLAVGERRTEPMVAVFMDLTSFTSRTFWDDQDEVVDLAHAVLSGFIEVVSSFGGFPLGLRGDGLFAGFSPGDERFTALMALASCAFALDAVETVINPWLDRQGMAPVQARAGADYGPITFVRTGNRIHSEINPLGFAANFASKCEKIAKSWEVVVGEGLANLFPNHPDFVQHSDSPKRYTRDYETQAYKFYDFRWRNTLGLLHGVIEALDGLPTSEIYTKR